MKTAYDIIRRPVITEQSMADTENKKYVFEVSKDATKIEIAKAVVPLLHVRDRHAAKNAVVGGLPTSLRIEGGAVQHHQIPALLLPARQHRSVELPEIGVLIIELCGFHRRLLCVFFPIMPQTPPHCNAAYSASAASSSAVSPGCTASEMP